MNKMELLFKGMDSDEKRKTVSMKGKQICISGWDISPADIYGNLGV